MYLISKGFLLKIHLCIKTKFLGIPKAVCKFTNLQNLQKKSANMQSFKDFLLKM